MAAIGTARTQAQAEFVPNMVGRRVQSAIFVGFAMLALFVALGTLAWLLVDVFRVGVPRMSWEFLTGFDSRFADRAGILAALVGSVYMMAVTIVVALPLGVAAATYLEEYAPDNWLTGFIQINVSNLAAIPSIIFGLLGLQLFVRTMGLDRSVLAGGLTMALLVLPIVIVASREAIRAVPPSMREASLALGATKWQTIRNHVLPYALSGILTGNILGASRAIGETAPLITIGALTFVPFVPENLLDRFTVLPIQIFNWTSRPNEAFLQNAAAGIVLLLVVLLLLNSLAIFLRARFRTRF